MNVAEGLRAAGYLIPYPKGLEWIDKVAQGVCDEILKAGIENWSDVLQKAVEKLKGKREIAHIRWALQDGLHRATIKHYEAVEALDLFSRPVEEEEGLFI